MASPESASPPPLVMSTIARMFSTPAWQRLQLAAAPKTASPFVSPRRRAAFRMRHQNERVDYAMFDFDEPQQPRII